ADSLAARVEATLARHLDGPRIAAWLETLPAGSLEDEAARWILAWLPLSDCAELRLPLLREHVEQAAAAYRESPWRAQIPHALWLHFIVPHRVSQEPAQPWRAAFARALAPRVAGAPTMEAAALAVNRWCREQATYTPSSGRDLGPLGTIARGLGRCEEETILAVCALRAAGLPARSCATPYWTFTDSNHAWVEVWTDGAWHYLGGCEPDRCLDRAWFTGAARRAGFVRSAAYGEFDPAPEPLYRAEQGVTLINSTPVYGDPIHLRAALAPAIADQCAPELTVNVLNFGSLRALAKVAGGGEIALGPGEYALTAGNDSTLYLRVVGGASGTRLDVTLDAGDRYDLDTAPGFWLRYPEEDARPARDLNLVSAEEEAALARAIAARDADRRKLREPSAAEAAALDSLPAAQAARWRALLDTKPYTRASALFALLAAAADSLAREDLLAVLEAMDDKDLVELGEETIAGELALAQAQRGRLAALGLAVPDSILRAGQLASRIDRETAAAWRRSASPCRTAFCARGSSPVASTARRRPPGARVCRSSRRPRRRRPTSRPCSRPSARACRRRRPATTAARSTRPSAGHSAAAPRRTSAPAWSGSCAATAGPRDCATGSARSGRASGAPSIPRRAR
ncbi:transglutaminase domain-containing protein, partial [bacterium]|nr:transglutaminase domain-containing protein [bacterium]